MRLALSNGVAHVGGNAEILEVTKRHDNGGVEILPVGGQPYRVVDLFTNDSVLKGTVDDREERESPIDPQKPRKADRTPRSRLHASRFGNACESPTITCRDRVFCYRERFRFGSSVEARDPGVWFRGRKAGSAAQVSPSVGVASTEDRDSARSWRRE